MLQRNLKKQVDSWGKILKILISVKEESEVVETLAGATDDLNNLIVDVKNPREGSLGANFPWVIQRVKRMIPNGVEMSVAVGDMPNLPGTASLAALGSAHSEADYIKVGLRGISVNDKESAVYLMKQVVRAVKDYNDSIRVVAAGYADFERAGTLHFSLIPEVASESGADVAMLDTAIKDGESLFVFRNSQDLSSFVDSAHNMGLLAALAGSLNAEDTKRVAELGADVVGFRGAACAGGDRREGLVHREKVAQIMRGVRD